MNLYRLRPALGASTRPISTRWTEKIKCEACQVVRSEPLAEPPLYEVRISNRPKRPGLFLTNQPTRALLIRGALWEALQERGLDAGLRVFPAKVTNYACPYFVIAPRVRLQVDLSGLGPPVMPCELCGGNSFGHVQEPTFHPPHEEQHWYDTNVIRDPGVIVVVSESVRDFFATPEGEKLLAPSKILPLPEFERIRLREFTGGQ